MGIILKQQLGANELISVKVAQVLLFGSGGVLVVILAVAELDYRILKDVVDFFDITSINPSFMMEKNIDNFQFLDKYSTLHLAQVNFYLRIVSQLVLLVFIVPTVIASLLLSIPISNLIGLPKLWAPFFLLGLVLFVVWEAFYSSNSFVALDGDFSGIARPGVFLEPLYSLSVWIILCIIFFFPSMIIKIFRRHNGN